MHRNSECTSPGKMVKWHVGGAERRLVWLDYSDQWEGSRYKMRLGR